MVVEAQEASGPGVGWTSPSSAGPVCTNRRCGAISAKAFLKYNTKNKITDYVAQKKRATDVNMMPGRATDSIETQDALLKWID